jgi:uncharacterized protein (TIGR00730 family)
MNKRTSKSFPVRPHEDRELLRVHTREERDFTNMDPWRVLRIQAEIVDGFDALHALGPAVTFFGSARLPPEDPFCVKAEQTAGALAKAGLAVITGGGPGIMQAANKGAHETDGISVGCNIELPFEEEPNPNQDISVTFRYFFVRKVMLVKYSVAFVIFPGGFGTMDELFEALTLSQTGKIEDDFPIVLCGRDYWSPLIEWFSGTVLAKGCIDEKDLNLPVLLDEPEEIVETVVSRCKKHGHI